jgi:hypothetical protein
MYFQICRDAEPEAGEESCMLLYTVRRASPWILH